jgi:pimeloyl-ACP methyl ester carboxylesterase
VRRVGVGAAELCVDTHGDPAHSAVLLVMGAAASMDRWEPPFCERVAAAGFHVVRYDHRDTGGSTTYPPGEPGYTGDDLFEDAVRVLDALGIERAHLVGMSMGGALVQRIAVEHPDRVLSVAMLSTSLAGTGGPDLPGACDELRASFTDPTPEPDWGDRDAAIAYLLDAERPYAGARGVDEDAARGLLGRVHDRSASMASGMNHYAVDGSEMSAARLAEIRAPALVVHGTADPLFPPAHGEALARAIPGANLVLIDDLGHELPRWAWDEVLEPLITHLRGALPGAGC